MQDEVYDTTTGEVLTDNTRTESRAADGGIIPAAAYTAGDAINQLEDGAFQADMHRALADLIGQLNEVADATQAKATGTLTMKLKITKEDNALKIAADFDTKAPKMPRPRSIMWTDDQNNLTRFPPNQMQMFGLRQVGGSGGLRRA